MSAAGIVPLVIFVVMGLLIAFYYYKRRRSGIERTEPDQTNLMDHGYYPKAPTPDDVDSIGSLHEGSERSNMDVSRHSHMSSIVDDEGSGVFNIYDKKEDLVNVAII
jgi:hypothetical protein